MALKRIAFASALPAVLAAAVVGVLMIGEAVIQRLVTAQALEIADLWYNEARRAEGDPLRVLARGEREPPLKGILKAAQIDALVLVREDGAVQPVGGSSASAAADFEAAAAPDPDAGRSGAFALPPGAYSRGDISWLGGSTFRNWVLFPPVADSDTRLAVRVRQDQTVVGLMLAFGRKLIFLVGTAGVTFFSFMAGFTYRERQLGAEDEDLRFLALHDELTGLPNRKRFDERLNATMAALGAGDKLAVFFLDLDGFKPVNDVFGHAVGDDLLRAVAGRLKGALRSNDLLARLGGDEFAILVPHLTDTGALPAMARRIRDLLCRPFSVDGNEILIGCSIGIAIGPENGATPAELLRNADFALYRAKNEGRRTWRFFDPAMADDMRSRRTIEGGLRHALENEQFTLLYQPQVSLETGAVIGYEALLRWRLPGRGLVPTAKFLGVAEESGFIVPMGEWVIRQAARDCRLLPPHIRLAINLSANQLKRESIDQFLAETLRQHEIDPKRLDVEITESILGRNEADALARLEEIRALGVSIVMDNFGVGTSSIGLLTRYPFDKVKVDRSFMLGIEDDQKKRAVVASICNLGRSLGMAVAGEGVETQGHALILRAAGCAQAQGYHFGRPRSFEQVLEDLGLSGRQARTA